MKRIKKLVLFSAVFVSTFVSCIGNINAKASHSEVQIKVEESKNSFFYYEIIEDGTRVLEDMDYRITDKTGKTVFQGEIKDGILQVMNVPWGDYDLVIWKGGEYHFFIRVDKEYMKTQHVLKQLILDDSSMVKTGDYARQEYYGILLLLSFLLVVYMKNYKEN